ncbi:MAG: L,D-transpeptidase family protein [Steroidobacteraceae bacterium]
MTFRTLATLLVLACRAAAAHADAMPQAPPQAQALAQPAVPQPTMFATGSSLPVVDRVVVKKSERRLYLMGGGNIVRSYHVSLGLNPIGQKERSGDFRTPEGSYRLEQRNERSDYFLSIKVSYPNETDLRRARTHRWDSGGSIMIHGEPNFLKHDPDYYLHNDWTDGCIAVSNADMLEIWMLVPDGVPIDILP